DERRLETLLERIDPLAKRDVLHPSQHALARSGAPGPVLTALEPRVVGRKRDPRLLGPAEEVEREIHGNATEPRVRVAPTVDPIPGRVRPNERWLRPALRRRAVVQQMQREPENAVLMAPNEPTECRAIPGARLLDEFAVVDMG